MIKEKIIEYLDLTIQTKKNMRKRIYQLDEENKELKIAVKEIGKQRDKFRESNRLLRRKLKDGSVNKKKGNR